MFEEKNEKIKFASLFLRDEFLKELDKNISKERFDSNIVKDLKERLEKGDLF